MFKTVAPTWGILGLGTEVAELIGLPRFSREEWDANRSTVAFLDRGKAGVRVISIFRSAQLFADSIVESKMVAQAVVASNLTFNLPDAVERRLGVQTTFVSERNARRTFNPLAWLVPAEEYYAYREATKDGKPYQIPPAGPAHLYLIKSEWPGLVPSLKSLEGGEPEVPASTPLVQVRKAKRVSHSA